MTSLESLEASVQKAMDLIDRLREDRGLLRDALMCISERDPFSSVLCIDASQCLCLGCIARQALEAVAQPFSA